MRSPSVYGRMAERAIAACREIASFSEEPTRTTRTFLSPPMRECHCFLRDWMERLGMSSSVDAIGNLRGVYDADNPGGPRLAIGSHLDTVPDAGAFDGVLGVVLALSLIELLGGERLPIAIEVLGFSEEEGVRFRTPFLGSRAYVGALDTRALEAMDSGGFTVADAMRNFGLDPSDIPAARYTPGTRAYLEFHIEQGPVLENLDLPLAVVSGIVGQSRAVVSFIGRASHAGTTPVANRLDALTAAAEWILFVENTAREQNGLVATVGQIEVAPGVTNVVPGAAQLSLDVRHAHDAVRRRQFDALLRAGTEIARRRRLDFEYQTKLDQPACPMHERLTRLLMDAVQASGVRPHSMPSGAGHDAMIVAPHIPSAMLFLRSPGGISHHPSESVLAGDVALALEAGLSFLKQLSACDLKI